MNKYADELGRAADVLRTGQKLNAGQSLGRQLYLLMDELYNLLSNEKAFDIVLDDLIQAGKANDCSFDEPMLRQLYAFFATEDLPRCERGAAAFLEEILRLRGTQLIDTTIGLLMMAGPDSETGDLVTAISVKEVRAAV